MKGKKRISSYILILLIVTSVIPVLVGGSAWFYNEIQTNKIVSQRIKQESIDTLKTELQLFASDIDNRISYNDYNSNRLLRRELKTNGLDILSIISNIHEVVSDRIENNVTHSERMLRNKIASNVINVSPLLSSIHEEHSKIHSSESNQRRAVLNIFKSINYSSQDVKFCVFTEDETCQVHPSGSQKEGKRIKELAAMSNSDGMGMVDQLKLNDGIYKEWYWPRKEGWEPEKKIGYFLYYRPLNLFIGSVEFENNWSKKTQDTFLTRFREMQLIGGSAFSTIIFNKNYQVISGIEEFMAISIDSKKIRKEGAFSTKDRMYFVKETSSYGWTLLVSTDVKNTVEYITSQLRVTQQNTQDKIVFVCLLSLSLIFLSVIISAIIRRHLARTLSKLQASLKDYIEGKNLQNNGKHQDIPILELYEVQRTVRELALAQAKIKKDKEILTTQLHQSEKIKNMGMLVGGLAHDMNNLLTSINCYPDYILENIPQDSVVRKPIILMRDAGKKAGEMMADIVAVARGVACEKKPILITKTLATYLTSAEFSFLKDKYPLIDFTMEVVPDLKHIEGSETHINKIAANMIKNAYESIGEDKKGKIICRVKNKILRTMIHSFDRIKPGEYVTLTLEDSGSGISKEALEKIFDPFYSSKNISATAGTGLGLSIVWNIMQDHDTSIAVQSKIGVGTIFTLFFPPCAPPKEHQLIITDMEGHEVFQGSGERILIIEDDKTQQVMLSDILNGSGYNPTTIETKKEAIERMTSGYFDLLIIDMNLKNDTGEEVYEEVLRINPKQRALIVSGFAETSSVEATIRMGAYSFISKPYTPEKLLKNTHEALISTFKCEQ